MFSQYPLNSSRPNASTCSGKVRHGMRRMSTLMSTNSRACCSMPPIMARPSRRTCSTPLLMAANSGSLFSNQACFLSALAVPGVDSRDIFALFASRNRFKRSLNFLKLMDPAFKLLSGKIFCTAISSGTELLDLKSSAIKRMRPPIISVHVPCSRIRLNSCLMNSESAFARCRAFVLFIPRPVS